MNRNKLSVIIPSFVLIMFGTVAALLFAPPGAGAAPPAPVNLSLAGDWTVKASLPASSGQGSAAIPIEALIQVQAPCLLAMSAERHNSLPLFNGNASGWTKGDRLLALCAQETTTRFLLDPASLVVRAGPEADADSFRLGEDFEADIQWGTIGRKAEGRIKDGQPVFISYRYAPQRLDAIVLTRAGEIILRPGEPRTSVPKPPGVAAGERRLGNVWIPGRIAKLGPENLLPVLEAAFPEPVRSSPVAAEKFAPKAMTKLRNGKPLRILAWGDSVTDGGFLPNPETERWQAQFVTRLRALFPQAKIELVTEAWGGRNTDSYLKEPPGSPHNYREKVLAAKPDLVVSEFVNDGGLSSEEVETRYGKFFADFTEIGAEWIILTPHYIRPEMMGLDRERDIDEDPRPYVTGLRQFAAKHNVALADAAQRYGRLWRQGIPYSTLFLNSINHPDAEGMKIFADALMALFP
jgi:lysophospholipase L1-like esterase